MKYKKVTKNGTGNCYEVHANHITNIIIKEGMESPKLKNCLLCHGDVLGAVGSKVQGKQFGHAWIELNGDMMLDISNGNEIVCRIDQVEHRIVRNTVKRYTPQQVAENLIKFEHYGEWE